MLISTYDSTYELFGQGIRTAFAATTNLEAAYPLNRKYLPQSLYSSDGHITVTNRQGFAA
jgi:hypothetical protein